MCVRVFTPRHHRRFRETHSTSMFDKQTAATKKCRSSNVRRLQMFMSMSPPFMCSSVGVRYEYK